MSSPHFAQGAEVRAALKALARERVLLLDGAMGTMIQDLKHNEEIFRGARFKDWHKDQRGNNDVLVLSQPDVVREIHLKYFLAGADICETNTFSSTSIAQADYGLESYAGELNREGARLAKQAADLAQQKDGRRRFVAGALGPTNRTASISPNVNDPGFRAVTFDDLRLAYAEASRGLIEGGADLLLIETIFDTLNAKAAYAGIADSFAALGVDLPIMLSGTITDLSGRTLSGQTPEAFWNSLRHTKPISVGLNCALGAREMRAHIAELSRIADTLICAYPNAGLPNEFGLYDESPEYMAALMGEFADAGLVNIIGGCCGTTPDHIAALADRVRSVGPRKIPKIEPMLRLAGLEPFTLTQDIRFVNVGERTNVTGSARFRKLITNGDYAAALDVAREQNVDVIGLSGLITPSLDEMSFVAAELEREGFTLPLLIGGATTSRVHTAVKIHPNYSKGQAVYVTDASRAVSVVSSLLSPEGREPYVAQIRSEYQKVAETHQRAELDKQRLSLQKARANSLKLDWQAYQPPKPFFQTWEMKGRYPAVLEDPKQGAAARQLFEDAQIMLARIVEEHWFQPRAVIGFWPANGVDDDIHLYSGESRQEPMAVLHSLRQQLLRRDGRPNLALADFVAPKHSHKADYIGGFVVTAGAQEEKIADRFAKANDDYGSIMVKALADRIAEAFAERMHERVRREFWAYAPHEVLSNEDRINEAYAGIRPAPGYPAQPDHTEKATLFSLLGAERRAGVKLTESYAMWPGSSVAGLYLSHPEAHYFGVAKIERDQVEDYALRKGMDIGEVERWLGPILNYDPTHYRLDAAE